MQRLITGLILGAGFIAVVLSPPFVFALGVAFVVGLGSWECYRMLEAHGARPFKWFGIAIVLGIVWMFWRAAQGRPLPFGAELPVVAATIGGLVLAMARRPDPATMLGAARSTVFAIAFVGLPLAYLVPLRTLDGAADGALLWLLFVVVFSCDTGAFYIGSKIGKRRLAPKLSPKKSVEGAVGGALVGMAGAFGVRALLIPELSIGHTVILALLLATSGILGDLAESLVKRATGFKDSSGLLPGHGGVLDRIDSLLFSSPILYYYWTFFVQGSP